MTLYSCLPLNGKTAVVATWAGQYADSHSAKITTVSDPDQARSMVELLTTLSECMWDAAAWLDVYDVAESRMLAIVEAARAEGDVPTGSESMFDVCRHRDTMSAADLTYALDYRVPQLLNSLTRTQRLSVADELAAEADARTASLKLLPTGHDPADASSRIWQAVDVTRVVKAGLSGPLPDGAAGWMVRIFDTERSPAERWAARTIITRLEQLAAASKTVDGRGGPLIDPFMDHIVLPAELFGVHIDSRDGRAAVDDDIDPAVAGSSFAGVYRDHVKVSETYDGDAVLYIAPDIDLREIAPWDRDVFAKLTVTLSVYRKQITLATLDAADTEGFVIALGRWAAFGALTR